MVCTTPCYVPAILFLRWAWLKNYGKFVLFEIAYFNVTFVSVCALIGLSFTGVAWYFFFLGSNVPHLAVSL